MQNKAVTRQFNGIGQACLTVVLVCLLNSAPFFSIAKADKKNVIDESTLRAAIILKIIHQVSWPEELGETIYFCGNGNSQSYKKLLALRGKQINRGLSRIAFTTLGSTETPCHIQIIGPQLEAKATIAQEPLLVICDDCGVKRDQAAVELIKDRDHIRFNLNLIEAQKKKIRFKVPLLELAKTVKGHND